ncbi:MAG: hypothetical protein K6G48_06940 [Acholeplasmatales bacterium]|nr:hypothetical protein [Acholeplasmatales bacterium]
MKFNKEAFDTVLQNTKYEGADTYLIDDNKNKVDYHIYLILIESGNVASIICEKMPTTGDLKNYEIYEFNGNKLLEHNIVRIKALDKDSSRFNKIIEKFKNRQYN